MTKLTADDVTVWINLYTQGMSPYQIEKVFNGRFSATYIRRKLIEAGIPQRDRSESKKNPKVPSLEVLKKHYVDEQKSTYEIGKMYDVSAATIWHRLKIAGVELRDFDTSKENQKKRKEES